MKRKSEGTFALNKTEPIHRWYSYIEGYSSILIDNILNEIDDNHIKRIYDPFCGTGTTCLVASHRNIDSYYSESNPFMQEVIDVKINCTRDLINKGIGAKYLRKLLQSVKKIKTNNKRIIWDGFEKYFNNNTLSQIKEIDKRIEKISENDSKRIAKIGLASIIVKSSKMLRQGDLRYAKMGEKNKKDFDAINNYCIKLNEIIDDIENNNYKLYKSSTCIAADARDNKKRNYFDCVITSPPYLNGTNYIRNTKLELKLLKYVIDESDIAKMHSKGIVAGINNVNNKKNVGKTPHYLAKYINKLDKVSYDPRIQKMIIGYFNDMDIVIKNLSLSMKNNGYFIMDIGDSQFAGVHIPTHEILNIICKKYGFELYDDILLRERRSKNQMILTQRLLKYRLVKKGSKCRTIIINN